MAYQPPGVNIYQKYVTPAPVLVEPDLPATIVGPAFRIVDQEGVSPAVYAGSQQAYDIDGLEPSDVLKGYTSTFKAYIRNAADLTVYEVGSSEITLDDLLHKFTLAAGIEVSFANYSTANGEVETGATYTLKSTGAEFEADKIIIGDKVVLDDGTDQLTTTVIAVIDDTHLQFKDEWTHGPTTLTYTITRPLSGAVLCSCKALRTDIALQMLPIDSYTDIATSVGDIDPDNPLGYALSKAYSNSQGQRIYGMAIPEDTPSGYLLAKDQLNLQEAPYAITPLFFANDTAWASTAGAFVDLVRTKSSPERCEFAVLNMALKYLPDEEILVNRSGLSISLSQGGNEFEDSGATFETVEVAAGDKLRIVDAGSADAVEADWTILGVASEHKLFIAGTWPAAATVAEYKIVRENSKSEKATALKKIGQAYLNHRVRLQVPQYCKDGNDVVEGYHISAAVSGQDAGMNPPSSPTTNYPLNGFSDIMYANGYFEPADLNEIAEGGIEIFIQDVPGAPFLSRHQMTTDTTQITKRERSIVRAVDWFSRFAKKALAKFIGRNNISGTFLTILRFIVQALINFAKDVKRVVAPGTVLQSLEQNADQPDHVDVTVKIANYFPANYIIMTVFV